MLRFIFIFFLICLSVQSIISQELQWAHRIGAEYSVDLAIDDTGNIYIVGFFLNTKDFDPGPSNYPLKSNGSVDFFIQKLDSSGNLLWARSIGGTGSDVASSITLDAKGFVYITGLFNNTVDFDPDSSVSNLTSHGKEDIFILKLKSTGKFVWARHMGGTWDDVGSEITVDNSGNIYTIGTFEYQADFDPGNGTFIIYSGITYRNVFVQKLDSGGKFIWAKALIGGISEANGIVLDDSSNIYITGGFQSTNDFDPGPGKLLISPYALQADMFVWKLDLNGNLVWAKTAGAYNTEKGQDITINSKNQIVITGRFQDTVDFNPGSGIKYLYPSGNIATFILILDIQGSFVDAKSFGGTQYVYPMSISIDVLDNIYIIGNFGDTIDFSTGLGSQVEYSKGKEDIFIFKGNPSGNMIWGATVGSNNSDRGLGIALDDHFNIHFNGYISGNANFSPGPIPFYLASFNEDVFVSKWSQDICSNLLLSIDSVLNNSCAKPGYISTVAAGGNGPISYSWQSAPSNSDSFLITNQAGLYKVSIEDTFGCSRSRSILINGPKSISQYDLNTNLTATEFRPGFTSTIWLNGYNDGCQTISGQMILELDSALSYVSATPAPNIISGKMLEWNFTNITYDSSHLKPVIKVKSSSKAQLDQHIKLKLEIKPLSNDTNPANNSKSYFFQIVNSFDPNNKLANPSGSCDNGFISPSQTLTYTINFQNTGTAKAININILDTLSSHLDLKTLKVVGQSHHPTLVEVLSGNTLKFNFNNINLPDSNSNEPASHGYITYEISPKDSLPDKTLISNKAAIIFDNNVPVITNEVRHTITYSSPYDTSFQIYNQCDDITINGIKYNSSGTYKQTLKNKWGCDSLLILDVTIRKPTRDTITVESCHTYHSPSGTHQWDSSGVYLDTILNAQKCDSIITIILKILKIDTAITVNQNSLKVLQPNASYQWIDCHDGSIITGATSQHYTPIVNGSYAAIINYNQCIDTTGCVEVTNVGILPRTHSNNLTVFPNPTSGTVSLYYSSPQNEIRIKVLSITGQILDEYSFYNTSDEEISIQGPDGIYLLRIITSEGVQATVPIIKNQF